MNNDLKYLEEELSRNPSGFLVGAGVSLADIMVAFSAHFVLVRGLGAKWSEDTFPNIKKWIRKLQAREAWKKAAQQGEESYTLDAATKDS